MLKICNTFFFCVDPEHRLQSCHCNHVLQAVLRFSQWTALYWWGEGEKKSHKNPRKKSEAADRTSVPLLCGELILSKINIFLPPLVCGEVERGLWNLSGVYKWNQDKAECFLLSSTQWQTGMMRNPSSLLPRPEVGWEEDLKDATSTFFHYITSNDCTGKGAYMMQAKPLCRGRLFLLDLLYKLQRPTAQLKSNYLKTQTWRFLHQMLCLATFPRGAGRKEILPISLSFSILHSFLFSPHLHKWIREISSPQPPSLLFAGSDWEIRTWSSFPAHSKHVGRLYTSPALWLAPFHHELRKHRAIPKYYKHQTVLLLQTPSVKMMKQDRKISLLPLPFIYNWPLWSSLWKGLNFSLR